MFQSVGVDKSVGGAADDVVLHLGLLPLDDEENGNIIR